MKFLDYIEDVKSQLTCNASDEYKKTCITFEYTSDQIDENLNYFKKCMILGYSAYKALTFFYWYLENPKSFS